MVDVDALDSLHLSLDKLRQLLKQQQHVCLGGITTGSDNHFLVTVSLLSENLVETLGLCLHLGIDGVSITLGIDANLLSLGLGLDNPSALLYLLRYEDVGILCRALTLRARLLGKFLCGIGFLKCLGLLHLL